MRGWWTARLAMLRGVVSGRHREQAWYVSLATSTVLHLGLVAAMSLWLLAGPSVVAVPRVDTRWTTSSPSEPETLLNETEVQVTEESLQAGGATAAVRLLPARSMAVRRVAPVREVVSRSSFQADPVLTDGDLTEGIGEGISAAEVSALDSGGFGGGTGQGDGTGSGFFGVNVRGERFVYVVDGSRSMNHPHDSLAKTRFRRLKIELVRSISRLQPDQQFYIIFFNEFALRMPSPTMQYATPASQMRYLKWMTGVRADGDTDPRMALAAALRLRPDTIYFLTDGSFPAKVEKDLRRMNAGRVTIHTYAFGNRAAEDLLKAIAQNNGGRYRYIP